MHSCTVAAALALVGHAAALGSPLSAAAAPSGGPAPVGGGCNIDLTTKGLPACAQVCPEWCWATVIGEVREYYTRNVSSCHLYECQVVSGVRKASCCQNSTECAAAKSGPMGCGNPSSPEEILQGFQQEIPSQEWVHMHGRPGFECHPGDGCWPQEATLQKLLAGGAETPGFGVHFIPKPIFFTRQARDRHKENAAKAGVVVSQVCPSPERPTATSR
jgi:hypothetical protein